MIYLFVLGDSLTGWEFTAGAEELTECCGPLQVLGMRLWPCTKRFEPARDFLLRVVPGRCVCGGSFCFMSWYLKLLCCWRLMYVFIF